MTLRRIEIFVAVVESGGFRACSDLLDISPAAVSHQVSQLEHEIGHRLFVRTRGRMCGLTEHGARAYAEAKDLLSHASRFGDLLGVMRSGAARQVTILADAILEMHLAKHIAAFVSEHPQIQVSLRRSHFEEMIDELASQRADIAYFYSAGPVSVVPSERVWLEPICICAGADHAIFLREQLALQDLQQFPFVAPPAGAHFRRSVDALFRRQGIERYPIALETSHANIAREAVIGGFAISAVVTRYLNDELLRQGVRQVPVMEDCLALEVRRAVRREFALDRTLLLLLRRLNQAAPEPGYARQRKPPSAALQPCP
jgi:DNA-binding transcriptional LysR family regulator